MEAGMSVSGSPFAGVGKKTGVGAATCVAGRALAMRRHAMMLGLLVASVAASERAQARCDPDAKNNVTATCTGTTLNQNPPNGYGTGNEINLNTTVVRGATVTGTADANATGIGIFFNTGSVTNFGTIIGTGGTEGAGIAAFGNATVANSGTISGTSTTDDGIAAGIAADTATVTNSGTISGTAGGNGVGIDAGSATVFNSGTIIGAGGTEGIGIRVGAAGNVATSGTIIGSGGTAIQFNGNGGRAASDILTVLPGARFGGLVDFGGGADTVNFGPGSWILNTARFDAGLSSVNTSGNPSVVTPTQIIVADLSGFAAQNRAILDITGWIGSGLPGTPVVAPGAGGRASAFAPLDTPSSPFDAFASFPSEALGSAKAPAMKAGSAVFADGNAG